MLLCVVFFISFLEAEPLITLSILTQGGEAGDFQPS